MFRTYVPVQGFDEGSFCRTVRALPWLVVAVVPVHVVHKTSEAPTLLAAEDKDDNCDNDYVNNDAVDQHVHVHVVHKTSEAPALFAAQDGDEGGDDDD